MSITLDASTCRFDRLPESTWPRLEAVDGGVFVTPIPATRHQRTVFRLATALAAAVPSGYEVLTGANVSPNDGQDGLIPDVVVLRTQDVLYAHPRDVVLVVEVERPSTGGWTGW